MPPTALRLSRRIMQTDLQWLVEPPHHRPGALQGPELPGASRHGPLQAAPGAAGIHRSAARLQPAHASPRRRDAQRPALPACRHRPAGARPRWSACAPAATATRWSPAFTASTRADEFWFDRKQGFAEHIASAFVILMRAMDVPARIVTGYQGGELNSVDGFWWCARAAPTPGPKSGSPAAAGCAWTRPRWSPRGASASSSGWRRRKASVAQALGTFSPTLTAQLRVFWEAPTTAGTSGCSTTPRAGSSTC